jgi:hypothetical protein
MKKNFLKRYERDAENNILIDVSVARAEELYNDFDRCAPHIRRDLDQDFVEYLIECTQEIGSEPFIIRISFSDPNSANHLQRIQKSLHSFFLYLCAKEKQNQLEMLRNSAVLGSIGLILLFSSAWINRLLHTNHSLPNDVLIEGVTVAAWVALWEAVALVLIGWVPIRRKIKLYQRLARATIILNPTRTPQ